MARRTRRRTSRRFGKRRELIWVTGASLYSLDGGTSGIGDGPAIVTKADWARDPSATGHLEKGCTLVRTILDFSIFFPPLGDELASLQDAINQVYACVRTRDEDDTTAFDFSGDGLDESLMQFGSGTIQSTGSSVATLTWRDRVHAQWSQHWDVRVKRKLTSEDVVEFLAAGSDPGALFPGVGAVESGQLVAASVTWRCLLQLP